MFRNSGFIPSIAFYVKPSIRVTTDLYDESEIYTLIEAAIADMRRVGIIIHEDFEGDIKPLVLHAIVLYCKGHFGSRDDATAMRECYAGLRDAMSLSSEYTTEPEENNSGSPEGGCV